jgi:hypothetical protein
VVSEIIASGFAVTHVDTIKDFFAPIGLGVDKLSKKLIKPFKIWLSGRPWFVQVAHQTPLSTAEHDIGSEQHQREEGDDASDLGAFMVGDTTQASLPDATFPQVSEVSLRRAVTGM